MDLQQGLILLFDSMFQDDLLKWYAKNARKLVFREQKEAYSIWISEIMAQQTRIEAMLPYYKRFIEKYPDIQSLSKAEDDDLTKIWQGLGYYNRVRNMKKCAIECMKQYQGNLPKTKAELKKLPGIGDYTAGAIASIAYDEKVSAVDGNVIRVFSRLYNITEDVKQTKIKKKIEKLVEDSLTEPVSSYNQALMELGALICIPKHPRCDSCPIQTWCKAYHQGDPTKLPIQPKKKERRKEKKIYYILVCKDKIHLVQRPKTGLLSGLYGFDEDKPTHILKQISLKDHVHVFSHVEWNMKGYLCEVDFTGDDFYTIEEIHEKFSIPSAFLPFLKQTERYIKEKNICQKL